MKTIHPDEAERHLKALLKACANLAAQHERFKELDPLVYFVHPNSLKAIAAAYKAAPHIHESDSLHSR
jgi:hypothetical protein